MDIVDTFNHLIPTEHLDDAIFLGTNLESEGGEEFSTSQHVIENSLKNMLSDKDPMLGSASSQFCLPVLDSTDSNLQMSSSSDCVRNLRQQPTEKQSSPSKVKSVLPPEHEVKRSKRSSSPSEQIHTSSSGSRRSTRAAHKQFTDKILTAEQKDENQLSNTCDETRDPLPLELKDHSENANLFILSKEKCDKEQCVISEPVLTHSQTTNHTVAELLTQTADEHVYEEEIFNTDKKTDVIYDNVHKELALLSGVVKCDLDVEKIAHSSVSDGSLENPIDQKVTVTDIAESNISTYNELVKEEEKLLTSGKKMLQEEKGSIKLSNVKKGLRKQKSTSDKAKPHLQPSSKTPKKVTAIKNTRMHLKSQKGKASGLKRADSFTGHVNNPERQNVVKVKKMLPENIKNVVGSSNEKLTKNVCSGEKTANLDNPIKHHMEDFSDNHCGFRDIAHPSQAHVRTRTKSLSQSTEKASKNLLSTISKASFQGKDFGEQTEALDTSEEKPKLKKSVPPRQRRSSKSISVDEPQLFVPDNIPAVKKDGTELTCASDKIAGSSIRHCCSCRKLHGNKFMVGCGRCDDWFHGECVGLSLSQAQHMETEDKEYLCPKCCAEDEAMEANDSSVYDNHQKIEVRQENKKESEKTSIKSSPISSPGISHDNPKQREDSKHKVKALRKDSGDGKQVTDSKDGDLKKHALLQRKAGATETHQNSEEKHERPSKELSNSQCNDEKNTKLGVHEKQDNKKKKQERKGPPPNLQTSSPPTPKPSIDQIRQSVRQSLKDILQKRISESSSKIPEERAIKVSSRIEKELFSFYRDTDSKYKNKYRSLMFNLKDPKNKVLYKRVLKGEITPEHLIKMSPEELASRELAAWRQRENRHTIEMIEKEQREAERRPITKITHKGEIEIESETPMKETEVMDSEEICVKPAEKEEEIQKEEELATESSDTTSHHKNHLFDLNCKICTGRMAPPAEEISPKKATNSSGLVHKQSDNGADGIAEPLSSSTSMLKIDALEGGKQEPLHDRLSSTASSSEQFHITDTAEDESTFLARLNLIWQGFLNMPSVAKFVIKAYPVSGSLEHLAEDLPESIQVGGRISPQTVWDYVDKIKASGTKETCVVRFCPVAEEDQITYTLLYSYFSSRKRYGVVANNMRQVKDMYLIPLGASEKIPHFFVPFDGPGLEANRPNLLLALIIRQKVKRLHSISIDDEPPGGLLGVPAEKKSRVECNDDEEEEEDEKNDFFNSCSAVLHKNRNRPQPSDTEEPQAVTECVPETVKLRPQKPLRFLPGVLVGWENPQSTLDLASRPLPVEDILQSLLGTTENTFDHKPVSSQVKKSLIEDTSSIIEVAEKSDDIIVQTETVEESTSLITVSATNLQGISLKGKPPDVSTDTYLSNINYNEESLDDDIYQSTEDKNDFDTYAHLNKMSSDESNSVSGENTTPTPSHTKRDPRQAAGRGHHINSSDIKDQDLSNIEENTSIDQEDMESISLHKKDKSKKQSYREKDLSKGGKSLQYSLTMEKEIDYKPSKASETKPFLQNILIDDTDPLQQFRRALAANKAQSQTLNNPQSQTSSAPYTETSKNSIPSFGGLKLQQSPFLSVKNNPSLFPFQHNPSFSLQSNAIFPYPPHIPPLLPTPLGMGFPRPPRFTSTDNILHNPLVAWHPAMQLSRQPPPYLGQVKPGPLLGPEQTRYQMQQTFAHKDHRPERRHSDPWDKQDRISERSSSRGSRGEYRQRYYSESHHSREKRQYEKDSDKDSERSRRRERDKESARDRDRKSRDDSHREKDRSKSSYSDKCGDRTHKESKSVDKSKNEERIHDKEKSKERNRDREEEKEREKSRREKALDHSDRIKSRK
ncbi:PHD finger protein 3 isoform X2 [Xenopus laevis]|uniref:PHD finger protein 3 isoform X2 n=1 Tax=Xenopus laevis TaxID=8355 RepID=A0A8J0VFH8_XENLA|nr:PHD finger protein 3 isoform X2 [Xenopus laevis]